MKSLSSLLAALIVVMFSSCSSDQTPESSEADLSSDSSAATNPSLENLPGLEARGDGGVNATGITPMDVTQGRPAETTTSIPSDPGTAPPSILPPGIPKVLGDGSSTVRVLRTGKAAPGEGPTGPDGKVIDAQAYLKQLREKQAQEAAQNAPQPPSRPLQAPKSQPATPAIRRLAPSEAPKLPRDSVPKKAE